MFPHHRDSATVMSGRHPLLGRALALIWMIGCGELAVSAVEHRSSSNSDQRANNDSKPRVTQKEAIANAVRVAKERFGGKGSAGSALDFEKASASLKSAAENRGYAHDMWWVTIPEIRATREPSG